MVVNAPPDGYTLLMIGAPQAINATLYEKLNSFFFATSRRSPETPPGTCQVVCAFAEGASATAASVVSRRNVNVSCRYRRTVVSVWLK
jgi:hypothetical protein